MERGDRHAHRCGDADGLCRGSGYLLGTEQALRPEAEQHACGEYTDQNDRNVR